MPNIKCQWLLHEQQRRLRSHCLTHAVGCGWSCIEGSRVADCFQFAATTASAHHSSNIHADHVAAKEFLYLASVTLMKRTVAPAALALPLTINGNLPTLISLSSALCGFLRITNRCNFRCAIRAQPGMLLAIERVLVYVHSDISQHWYLLWAATVKGGAAGCTIADYANSGTFVCWFASTMILPLSVFYRALFQARYFNICNNANNARSVKYQLPVPVPRQLFSRLLSPGTKYQLWLLHCWSLMLMPCFWIAFRVLCWCLHLLPEQCVPWFPDVPLLFRCCCRNKANSEPMRHSTRWSLIWAG